jgi:hypothetical protein
MIDYNADYEHSVQPDQGMCLHDGCGQIFTLNVGGSHDRCLEHGGRAAGSERLPFLVLDRIPSPPDTRLRPFLALAHTA